MTTDPTPLELALRVYPVPEKAKKRRARRRREAYWKVPDAWLVLDTETAVDATQRLTFGSFRFIRDGRCLVEGLFYADDLPADDLQTLRDYVRTRAADTDPSGDPKLVLLSRREFLNKFYRVAYQGRALVVGFNLPFDLSRLAFSVGKARGRFAGGFSLALWDYTDAKGNVRENNYRPRVVVKHIDSKRALMGFTGHASIDEVDRIPEESATGRADGKYTFKGHFLDLRPLTFSLDDRGYSLASACDAFGVEHGKIKAAEHGKVTAEYIDYSRRDVLATAELAEKALAEYSRHPIDLPATSALSPASIGKAYLRAMGIAPILQRQPRFPKRYLGFAQTAFYGGRTSANIRRIPVPVVYVDFLSMYPTVCSLFGLWRYVTARRIKVRHCKSEVQAWLDGLTADELMKPGAWPKMTGFVRMISDGDVLPTRAAYSSASNDLQVAVNYVHSSLNEREGLWVALPDVAASIIRTGRVPKILDAFRIEAEGQLEGLRPTALRGIVEVDPRRQDFFRTVIEERKRSARRADLSAEERRRLDRSLKTTGNATSYGIFAQMDRHEAAGKESVTCWGLDPESYSCRVEHPEEPGEYCFPPIASLITSGARLMLMLLETAVTDLQGTRAMEDTDSMAIVATEHGGFIACPGGPFKTDEGLDAVRALSWDQIREIQDRFDRLNPYDPDAIPGSILKIEDHNYDPETGRQRQLWCLAISAKRYALFLRDEAGEPQLLRRGCNNREDHLSEHGLGHLLNPSDPDTDDPEWISRVWLRMVRRSLALPTQPLDFESKPAVGRISVSSPHVLNPLGSLNERKPYSDQVKPFNFLLACHVKPLGHPAGADPTRFHLIAPFEKDPRKWTKMSWTDQYSGRRYKIASKSSHGSRASARVKTYGEVLREYEFHPEAKCADHSGRPCVKQTIGLLQRRHIRMGLIKYVGKESNLAEDVESGVIHHIQSTYTHYAERERDEWITKILPKLRDVPLGQLQQLSGLSRAMLQAARAGRRPHPKNVLLLTSVVRELKLAGGNARADL